MQYRKNSFVTEAYKDYIHGANSCLDKNENLDSGLLKISMAINFNLELSTTLQTIVELTCEIFPFEDASVIVWNPQFKHFEIGASTTLVGDSVSRRVRRSNGATRWIVENRLPMIVEDTAKDPFTANKMIRENQIKSYIGVPIRFNEMVVGVFYALSKQKKKYSQTDLNALQKLGDLVGLTIKNANLLKSSKDLNEYKSGMTRLAANELIQPLSLAIGFFDILADEIDLTNQEQIQKVEVIKQAHSQMTDLVDKLVRYEKLSTKKSLNYEAVDLNEIIKLISFDLNGLAASVTQKICLNLSSSPLFIRADKVLLHEAMMNLVETAIRYASEKREIMLKSEHTGEFYIFSITFNGPEIDELEKKSIFKLFDHLNSSKPVWGADLGLSLVKLIAELHGGRVAVVNSEGSGVNLSIYLPAPKELIDSAHKAISNKSEELLYPYLPDPFDLP